MPTASVRLRLFAVAVALICSPAYADAGFVFKQSSDQLALEEDGQPVLVFNHAEVQPPAGVEGRYAREGYIHPLYAPDGRPITEDFPHGHRHHRGLFWAWPAMTVKSQSVDIWHLRGIRPAFNRYLDRRITDDAATFAFENIWHLDDDEQTPTVRKRVRYTVHPADEHGRLIDTVATFRNLTDEPVILSGNPYGSLNVRTIADRSDVQITTANGQISEDANEADPPSPWADRVSRPADGEPHTGVAIFQHPDNPDYPARQWTLRFYGFLGVAWPGSDTYEISPGEELELKFRLYVHQGTAEQANVADRFEQYLEELGQ